MGKAAHVFLCLFWVIAWGSSRRPWGSSGGFQKKSKLRLGSCCIPLKGCQWAVKSSVRRLLCELGFPGSGIQGNLLRSAGHESSLVAWSRMTSVNLCRQSRVRKAQTRKRRVLPISSPFSSKKYSLFPFLLLGRCSWWWSFCTKSLTSNI